MERRGVMRVAAALAALGVAAAAHADDARWYVQVDNDVVFHTDRWYTSGVRIAREQEGLEWALLQEVFTPDAKHWGSGREDRSPTGRLLAALAYYSLGPTCYESFEIAAGVRGRSALGEQATDAIHRLIPAPEVDWSRQLGNRLDAHALAVHTQVLGSVGKVHVGGVVGRDVTFGHVGVEVGVGGASALLRFAPTPPWTRADGDWGAMIGASVRGMARNALLERNYDPSGAELKRRRVVSRVAAGVSWSPSWGSVRFELAQDSREFEGQHSPHRFGSLAVHLAF